MRTILLSSFTFFCVAIASAQCTHIIDGTYTVTDSTPGQPGISTWTGVKLVPYHDTAFKLDSVVGPSFMIGSYIRPNCSNNTLVFEHGAGCGSLSGTGTIDSDYNHMYITEQYSTGGMPGGPLLYEVYTRTPLLTQQQVDSIKMVLGLEPVVEKIIPFTNPVSQALNFSITSNNLAPTTNVKIVDLAGRCIYSNDLAIQSGQQVTINVQNLMRGMYILQAVDGKNKLLSLKFLKQ